MQSAAVLFFFNELDAAIRVIFYYEVKIRYAERIANILLQPQAKRREGTLIRSASHFYVTFHTMISRVSTRQRLFCFAHSTICALCCWLSYGTENRILTGSFTARSMSPT